MQKSFRSSLLPLVVAFGYLIALSGCATLLVAGAVVTTVDVIHDRRTVGEYIDDSSIELTARNYLISSKEIRMGANVKAVSWNGILLLSGEIESDEAKERIVQRLASIQGVRQVVDETTIDGKSALLSRSNDGWITTKLKSKLLVKTGGDANRIKVVTTRSTVYLMGIVTQAEALSATEIARSVRGVSRVVKVFEYL
ncbi:MAG TPA: BON domain-containing protein [Gammaproteobacteria bacterium]|jgi:osmotically-inducible protein OsmY|nr:BON domain-containing protein [Gammaproteobacteria bacterium]